MRTLLLPDLHGRADVLLALLRAAGVVGEDGGRVLGPEEVTVASVGDLVDGRAATAQLDAEILAVSEGLVDALVMGNHEAAFYYPHLGFGGFEPSESVRDGLHRRYRDGSLVPALRVGGTLVTHAGVGAPWDFPTAEAAEKAVWDVYANYHDYVLVRFNSPKYLGGSRYGLPAAALLDAVGRARYGQSDFGGILWADWREPKNRHFNQVVGHTPQNGGPQRADHGRTFTINIDTGASKPAMGNPAVAAWLGEGGEFIDYVEAAK